MVCTDVRRFIPSLLTPIGRSLREGHSRLNSGEVIDYLREHTEPLAPEYEATINLWLSRIDGTDQLPTEHETVDQESNEPNDYADKHHSEE
ncbi:hypothetical protein JCM17823_06140 [Halorubrum gandharaense]